MSGETDLQRLLGTLEPTLRPETYVFASVKAAFDASDLGPVMRFCEAEGDTLILPQAAAVEAGLDYAFACREITLQVHSSLEAVGLMAAVAGALKDAGIPANVVAGFYHDHIFVPADCAEQALECLKTLSDLRS